MNHDDLLQLQSFISDQPVVVVYFSRDACSVCKVLKPKVQSLLEKEFPRAHFYYIDCQRHPQIAGQFRVFAIPTVILFLQGKETTRFSRAFGIDQLRETVQRPYRMLFPDE